MRAELLERDLEPLGVLLPDVERELVPGKLFVTGGTGFVGKWLLESLRCFGERLGCALETVVLTRDAQRFSKSSPHLAGLRGLSLVEGDVRTFSFPPGRFDLVIHGATESSARQKASQPLEMLDTIVAGTRRVLDFAVEASARKVLLLSSGAVYGRQPPESESVSEDYLGGPDTLEAESAYAEGKRAAELLGTCYAARGDIEVKIARCFAFVGPYLPIDAHFAVGNFIGDALAGRCIRVKGDGRTVRSYLYAADLALWLWRILFVGATGRAYNVGSEQAITIADLARLVAEVSGARAGVEILGKSSPGEPVHRYVPSTARARAELGLSQAVALEDAVRRTLDWHRATSN